MRRLLLATTTLATLFAAATTPSFAADAPATTQAITAPDTMVGGKPGADYFLANYTKIAAWLNKVAGESDRMKLISIGKTAEGREQYMAVVSSPDNIRNLDRHREIAKKLALAKDLTDDQAKALAAEGKAVVWMDAGLQRQRSSTRKRISRSFTRC